MADSFFGFDSSLSNINDDDGGGGDGSEDEYNALNNETFGIDSDDLNCEVEYDRLAEQLESSRRGRFEDTIDSELEASICQLVLDETDAPVTVNTSNVWQHELQPTLPSSSMQALKNVCTVEELERQFHQNSMPGVNQQQSISQSFFQPRFPMIIQRPPGLQTPVSMPFAQQQMGNVQPMNNLLAQNNQMSQMNNPLMTNSNQMSQNVNQFVQNTKQRAQPVNQFLQNHVNQLNQPNNQLMQNMNNINNRMNQTNQMMQNQMNQSNNQLLQINQMGVNQINQNAQMMQNIQMHQPNNQMMQNLNQIGQSGMQNLNQMNHINQNNQIMQNPMNLSNNQLIHNQIGSNTNQPMMPNVNQMGQTNNPLMQNLAHMNQPNNQMSQSSNQMSQNNQMLPNVSHFGVGINQMGPIMGQQRPIGPVRSNFNSTVGPFNPNFRGPTVQSKPMEQQSSNQQLINQQLLGQQQQPNQQQMNQMLLNQQQPNHLAMNQQNMYQKSQSPLVPNQILKNSTNQNQSPQNKPNQNKQCQTQKSQKKNAFNNNGGQKNMTSQNLVQLIQNTHPMLQFNAGFHNASHHPMLNNRGNVFNTQVINNHPMFNNQRANANFNNNNNNRHMNGDEDSQEDYADVVDEYMGLMSQREKQWLLNIQMLQLNTGTPYIDDFYYTVFLERQSKKEKEGMMEAHKANQQNHPFYSGGVKQEQSSRSRHNSGRHNSTSEDAPTLRTYVPTQFENSLGKLQCGSVTAPRKIIDVDVVQTDSHPPNSGRVSVASSNIEGPQLRRTKQLLLDIEALYLILLRLEELNNPLAISNAVIMKEREEKQKQLELAQKEAEESEFEESNVFLRNIESVHRKPKGDLSKETVDKRQVVSLSVASSAAATVTKNLLDENKDELIGKIFSGLLYEDRVAQFLLIRKGKNMLVRFLSRVPPAHGCLRALWSRIFRSLPQAVRRDDRDPLLYRLHTYFHSYIHQSTGWAATLELCAILTEALDPARTPHVLTNSFTISAVCCLVEKASTLSSGSDATSNERQWTKFLKTFARALKNTILKVARPVQPLSEAKLTHHIKLLESRSTIEILQRGKTASNFSDLTKTDFSEQLIKHLC